MVRTLEQRSNSGATAPPPPVAGPGARPQ
jgi:hypothetical protein